MVNSPVIVALDFDLRDAALDVIRRLDPKSCRLKIGKELFTECGPSIVEQVQHMGFEVFLDLKFHDIPNTTACAVAAAARLGVWMVNVHASGGRRMMEACVERLSVMSHRPKLVGVTVLTSLEREDLIDVGLDVDPADQVMRLATLTKECGLDGLVCSAQEAGRLKAAFGSGFELVTPGIRPAAAGTDDQRRVMTPVEALRAGSDYLVIGRPITKADDPAAALNAILAEIG